MGAPPLTWPRMTGMLSLQGEAVTWAGTCVGMTGRQSIEKQVLPRLLVAGSHPGRGFRFKPPSVSTVNPTDSFFWGFLAPLERVRVRVHVSEMRPLP
jgi:hypothetical protein